MVTTNKYLMKLKELFELNWAIGSDISHAESPRRQQGVEIVWLKAKELLSKVEPDFRVTPDSKENHIGDRMNKASTHFKNGNWMDPPSICFNTPEYPVGFDDGRHRVAAAIKSGEEWIPAAISPDDVVKLSQYITIRKVNPDGS